MATFLKLCEADVLAASGPAQACPAELVWLHVAADLALAAVYISIPVGLYLFAARRKDLELKGVVLPLSAFILFGAATHLLDLWPLLGTPYEWTVVIKAAFAVLSATSVILLWRLMPQALAIPGPAAYAAQRKELETLEQQLRPRQELERQLKSRNADLERVVSQRTGQLDYATRSFAEEETKLHAILDGALDGMISISTEGIVLRYNRACEKIFGFTAEEVVGHNIKMLMPDDVAAAHDGYLKNYRETRSPSAVGASREVIGRRKDGSLLPLDLSVTEVIMHGEIIYNGILRDITKRVAAEQERETLIAELSQTNEELQQFTYIASHDLKAPLRGMDNIATWLEEDLGDVADEGAREKLRLLKNRVARMEELLKDILAYSRVGRERSQPDFVDCEDLLLEITEWVEPPSGFTIDFKSDFNEIYMPRTLLEHVLLNLISNAIKHHDRPNGVVRVSVVDRGDVCEFVVEDDGPGIPKQYQDKVFGLFQKLRPRDEVEGSGIGLAIVKKMVESVGGRIELHSPVSERGTAFHVYLPKIEPAQPQQKAAS